MSADLKIYISLLVFLYINCTFKVISVLAFRKYVIAIWMGVINNETSEIYFFLWLFVTHSISLQHFSSCHALLWYFYRLTHFSVCWLQMMQTHLQYFYMLIDNYSGSDMIEMLHHMPKLGSMLGITLPLWLFLNHIQQPLVTSSLSVMSWWKEDTGYIRSVGQIL